MASSVSGQNPVRVRLVGPSPAARSGAGEREREGAGTGRRHSHGHPPSIRVPISQGPAEHQGAAKAYRRGEAGSRLEGRLRWKTATAQSAWIPGRITGRRCEVSICRLLWGPSLLLLPQAQRPRPQRSPLRPGSVPEG